jgi:chromosome partitioning protein
VKNITLLSRKGGVGKSTSAIHIASAIASMGHNVLLADGDANLSALNWHNRGGQKLPCKVMDVHHLYQAVDEAWRAKRPFDFVVIDTPANPDDRKLESLISQADVVLLPSPIEAMCLQGLLEVVADLEHFAKKLGKIPPYVALLTRVKLKAEREQAQARRFLEGEQIPLLKTFVRESAAFQRASKYGCLVGDLNTEYTTAGGGANDYTEIAREVLEILGSPALAGAAA